jgi:ubiquitin-like protein Pup
MPTQDSGQSRARRQEDSVEEVEASTDVAERHEKLTEDVDAILDEIDDVLESNAEDFVRAFVQKGGQ